MSRMGKECSRGYCRRPNQMSEIFKGTKKVCEVLAPRSRFLGPVAQTRNALRICVKALSLASTSPHHFPNPPQSAREVVTFSGIIKTHQSSSCPYPTPLFSK